MSLAVEQTLSQQPAREVGVEVDRPERSLAAESFIMNAPPTMVPGSEQEKQETLTTSAPTKPKRSSYDMHRQYQDAMDLHEIITPTSEQHVDGEQAPVLPQRSALRASRLLLGLKISPSAEPLDFTQTPHEEYLSSEEDASSTSGDFSDFEYDSSSDDTPSPAQDSSKARVVSVVYSGKPSVINVPQLRRSISPNSIERPCSTGGLSDKAAYISDFNKSRRVSTVSTVSSRSSRSSRSLRTLPARSSSMQPPTDAMKARLGFLRIDPYASGSSYSLRPSSAEPEESREGRLVEDLDQPKTPKSPGHMLRGVARAMSIMGRKSAPRLNQAYLIIDPEPSPQPTSPLRSPLTVHEEMPEAEGMVGGAQPNTNESESRAGAVWAVPQAPTRPPPRPLLQPSVTHDDIVRMSRRNEQNKHLSVARPFHGDVLDSPISPMSPLAKETTSATSSKRMSSFSFGRRRMSVKLSGKFLL